MPTKSPPQPAVEPDDFMFDNVGKSKAPKNGAVKNAELKVARNAQALNSVNGNGLHGEPEEPNLAASGMREIPLDHIEAWGDQPRDEFPDSYIDELAESIKEMGVLEPILVRPIEPDKKSKPFYFLVAGECRFRASARAGTNTIPAIVRDLSDQEATLIGLVENVKRRDLNPVQIARSYDRLIDSYKMTPAELAKFVGKSAEAVNNTRRLLKLPSRILKVLSHGYEDGIPFTMGHARALAGLGENHEAINDLFDQFIKEGGWPTHKMEAKIAEYKQKNGLAPRPAGQNPPPAPDAEPEKPLLQQIPRVDAGATLDALNDQRDQAAAEWQEQEDRKRLTQIIEVGLASLKPEACADLGRRFSMVGGYTMSITGLKQWGEYIQEEVKKAEAAWEEERQKSQANVPLEQRDAESGEEECGSSEPLASAPVDHELAREDEANAQADTPAPAPTSADPAAETYAVVDKRKTPDAPKPAAKATAAPPAPSVPAAPSIGDVPADHALVQIPIEQLREAKRRGLWPLNILLERTSDLDSMMTLHPAAMEGAAYLALQAADEPISPGLQALFKELYPDRETLGADAIASLLIVSPYRRDLAKHAAAKTEEVA